ncbi:hypothetical protein ACTG9Q_31550 [Actinokineospora sp. 24-640]
MGESLDRAVKREQALEATRRAVEDWTRRYAGPVAELPFKTTVEQVPAGDRALVAEFLAKARRSQFEKGTVLAHPDGSDRMLTGIHGLGFRRHTAPVARRLHGERVRFIEAHYTSGLPESVRFLADGTRYVGSYPGSGELTSVLAAALVKR